MAILDSLMGAGNDANLLAQNPQALTVLGQIQNSIPQNDPFNLGTTAQIANGSSPGVQNAPQQSPVASSPQGNADAQPVDDGSSEDGTGGFLTGFMKGLSNLMTNPDAINALGAFGASLGNDRAGYESNMNAYVQRMDDRRKEAAAAARAKTDNAWREQLALTNSLYDQYTPESVGQFRQTGDYGVLKPNQKYTQAQTRLDQAGNRLDLTASGQQTAQQNADTRHTQVTHQINQDTYENTRKELLSGLDGIYLGDGTTLVTNPGVYTGSDGVRYRVDRNNQGLEVRAVAANEQKSYEEDTAQGNPSVAQNDNDIALLNKAIDGGKVGSFTGQVVGRSGMAQDLLTGVSDQDERDAYNAAKRINGYMQNQGIGAAKSMGASGINTESEAKRFFASMPQLDYTSPGALQSSLSTVSKYIDNYNSQQKQQKSTATSGTTQTTAPAQSPSGDSGDTVTTTSPDGRTVRLQRKADGGWKFLGYVE